MNQNLMLKSRVPFGVVSSRRSAIALLFAFGATALVICDGFHTYSGTTEYTHAVAWRAAWWVPLLFGSAGAGGGFAYDLGYERLRGPARLVEWPQLLITLAAFVGLYY